MTSPNGNRPAANGAANSVGINNAAEFTGQPDIAQLPFHPLAVIFPFLEGAEFGGLAFLRWESAS